MREEDVFNAPPATADQGDTATDQTAGHASPPWLFPAADGRPTLARLAKALYASRAKRRKFLSAELLSEPAWDILLDLYINHAEGRIIRTTSVCFASNSPATTALRWIGVLEQRGLLERQGSTQDQRAKDVRLTPQGVQAIEQCLVQYWDGLALFFADAQPSSTVFASPLDG